MQTQPTERIAIPHGQIEIDPASAAIVRIHLDAPDTEFVGTPTGLGLLRISAPLEHYPSHFLETGAHGKPELIEHEDGLQLNYVELSTEDGTFPVDVEIRFRSSDDGLLLSARVSNRGTEPLAQVIFPQLLDLDAIAGPDNTRIQLGRGRVHPFQDLVMQPDDAWWLDRRLQQYIPFGGEHMNMKWLDFGDQDRGLTLYSRNTRHTVQGVLTQRGHRSVDQVHLRWIHYPFIQPGETWESGEYVLLPHAGDWYAGAKAYQSFAAEHYPYHAPRRIREALGVRSVWSAVRNAPPNFPISELPEFAKEIADPELGITELILWHWWLKNGYPIFLDPRLGTEEEFRTAIQQCKEMGVPVVFFVSHHLVRDTDETDPEWLHLNAAMQRVQGNWTYGRDFLPLFQVPFMGTHAMLVASALSRGWREEGWRNYQEILDRGASGICFDVFGARKDPNFNPAIDGRPDEEGEKLLEFARKAREMIHEVNPDGTFSGEHIADVNVPVLDYTWEWKNGYELERAGPFRYVFPQYRLNANVNDHPRGALVGFMEGALLNVIPGNMRSMRLRDCPELVATLRKLAALRRRFMPYFTEGQYRFMEGLTVEGGQARLYTHGDRILVIVVNPTDKATDISIAVDPTVWGASSATGIITEVDLDGSDIGKSSGESTAFKRSASLDADTLRIIEFNPE